MLQGTVQPFGNNHKKREEKKACFDVVSLAHPICFGVQTGCCVQSLLIKMSSFTAHPLSLNTPCKLVSRPFKWQCCFSVPLSPVYLPPDRVVSHAVRCQTEKAAQPIPMTCAYDSGSVDLTAGETMALAFRPNIEPSGTNRTNMQWREISRRPNSLMFPILREAGNLKLMSGRPVLKISKVYGDAGMTLAVRGLPNRTWLRT